MNQTMEIRRYSYVVVIVVLQQCRSVLVMVPIWDPISNLSMRITCIIGVEEISEWFLSPSVRKLARASLML